MNAFADIQISSEDTKDMKLDGVDYVAIKKDAFENLLEAIENAEDIAAFDAAMKEIEENGSDPIPSEVVDELFHSDKSPLKIWREFRGMKASDLAEKSGESKGYISKLEASREVLAKAGSKKLSNLAKALNVEMDLLVF